MSSPKDSRFPPSKPLKDIKGKRNSAGGGLCLRRGSGVLLEEAAPGREVETPCGGQAWEIAHPIATLDTDWAILNTRFLAALENTASHLNQWIAGLCGPVAPSDLIFLDLETTGLSRAPLFLVGAMVWEENELVVRQFFARDFSEERAAVALFYPLAAGKKLLVTFNGKSFDVPFLRARAATHTAPFHEPRAHLDLLHVGRRAWGRHLPNCQLQTLERHICSRTRRGDIPSSQIPEAYHAFVRTGDAAQIGEILKHNLIDLITLADLMTRLPPL